MSAECHIQFFVIWNFELLFNYPFYICCKNNHITLQFLVDQNYIYNSSVHAFNSKIPIYFPTITLEKGTEAHIQDLDTKSPIVNF